MDFAMLLSLFAAVVGIAGGLVSRRLPASGKAGLALGLVPLAGVGLSMAFC